MVSRQRTYYARRGLAVGWACIMLAAASGLAATDPFKINLTVHDWASPSNAVLAINYVIPSNHYLYAASLTITTVPPAHLISRTAPVPVRHDDAQLGESTLVFHQSFEQVWVITASVTSGLFVELRYQGCGNGLCFLPQTRRFMITAQGALTELPEGIAMPSRVQFAASSWLTGWRQTGSASGYVEKRDLLAFLDAAAGVPPQGQAGASWRAFTSDPVMFVRTRGLIWTLLLVMVGGVLLNLTPCVLPMIPINLGIIGVGTQHGSRRRGLLLGGAYGAGIAIVYGALGLVVVITGSVFGALQGSPWFNAGISVLFMVLSLALFDVIVIDLTRLQRGGAGYGRFGAAFVAGGVSALLAGACVAPVLVAVLVLSAALYAQGAMVALVLPFLLGVGMALPWPFAGMGLAWLPKPGRWMIAVKYGFGVMVLILAAYYGRLAWNGFQPTVTRPGSIAAGDATAWQAALAQARAQGRPVFVDFWATWCKNCTTMEHTTFRDPVVIARLKEYTVIKVQAEHPDTEPGRSMLQALGISGLPTYRIFVSE